MVLQSLELPCVALHSMMSQVRCRGPLFLPPSKLSPVVQRGRLAALAKFKSGHVRILVATDVASRYFQTRVKFNRHKYRA